MIAAKEPFTKELTQQKKRLPINWEYPKKQRKPPKLQMVKKVKKGRAGI